MQKVDNLRIDYLDPSCHHVSRTPPFSQKAPLSDLENSSVLLTLQSKSRRNIDRSRRRRRTRKRLDLVHRGGDFAANSGSRPGRHHRLLDYRTGHGRRRDGDREVHGAGDDVALGDRRRGDGDGGGVGAGCEDHVGALVGRALADAGAGGGCADEHAAVEGHCLVCWGGEAAYAVRDATGRGHCGCRGEVDSRGTIDEFGDGLVVGYSLGARRLGRYASHWRRGESLAVGDCGGLLDVVCRWK